MDPHRTTSLFQHYNSAGAHFFKFSVIFIMLFLPIGILSQETTEPGYITYNKCFCMRTDNTDQCSKKSQDSTIKGPGEPVVDDGGQFTLGQIITKLTLIESQLRIMNEKMSAEPTPTPETGYEKKAFNLLYRLMVTLDGKISNLESKMTSGFSKIGPPGTNPETATPTPTPTGPTIPCVTNQGTCYYFVEQKKTWGDARQFCIDLNSDLVTIDNQAEDTFLVTYIKTNYNDAPTDGWYTGGNDINVQQQWKWIGSGEDMTYTNWSPGNPNNVKFAGRFQDCMHLWKNAGYKWDDHFCHAYLYFICEKPDR